MAVAHDASSPATALAGVTSASWSHTAAGADRLAVVGIGASTGGSPTVSAITYGGAAMSANGTLHDASSGQDVWLYKFVAPAASSQTVAITFSMAVYGSAGSVSVTGADQTTPMDAAVTTSAATESVSQNVTSTVGDMVIDTVKYFGHSAGPSPGASQTQRWEGQDGSFNEFAGSSTEPGAATVTMSWDSPVGGTDSWTYIAANIKASSGGADPTADKSRSHPRLRPGTPEFYRYYRTRGATEISSTGQVSPVTGGSDVGISSQAAVVKVAQANPVAALGLRTAGVAAKGAPAVAVSRLGVTSLDTVRKSAPVAPLVPLGLAVAPVTRKSVPVTPRSALGLVATVSRVPTAAVVVRAALGLVSTALGRKQVPAVASAPVGLVSASVSRKSALAVSRSTVGLSARGLVTKVAKATGAAAVGLSGGVARVPSVTVVVRAAFGLVSRATVTKKGSAAPTATVGATSTVTAKRVARPIALASVGVSAVGTVAKRVSAAVRVVCGLSGTATTSPATSPGQMYPRDAPHASLTGAEATGPGMSPRDVGGPQMTRREASGSTMTGGG